MIDIRIARPEDADAVARLAAATFPLACPDNVPEAEIAAFIANDLAPARFAEHLADPDRTILLATEDGEPQAYAMLVRTEPYDEQVRLNLTVRPTVEISKFYVAPEAHGLGLADQLMEACLDQARAHGAKGVWLGVARENARANRFYERQGFTVVGSKNFSIGDLRIDDDNLRERIL